MKNLYVKKLINPFCQFISVIFYPVFMPLYGIYTLAHTNPFSIYTPDYLLFIKILVGVFTLIVPLLILLLTMKLGAVSNFQIDIRRQRTAPYLLTLVSYGICLYMFYEIRVPFLLLLLSWGVIVSLLALIIINFWWKISAHATSAGGFLAAVLLWNGLFHINSTGFVISIILLCGLIGFARLYLRAHTPMQVFAGFLLGLFCVGLLPYLFIMF